MSSRLVGSILMLTAVAWAHSVAAQPADLPVPAATTAQYPPGVTVRKTAKGSVYADAQGRTLYGLDMRTLNRWAPDPTKYCPERCAGWEPMLASAGAKANLVVFRGFSRPPQRPAAGAAPGPGGANAGAPGRPVATKGEDQGVLKQVAAAFGDGTAPQGMFTQAHAPDWTIVDTPVGPQWAYKGWHLVYVRKGDKPGSTTFDGAEDFSWNTLKYVPPVPTVDAPRGIKTLLVKGAYVLADQDGRVLFTGSCGKKFASWTPLSGGMAAGPMGQWKVSSAGDTPQFNYRGWPVFVSQEDDPKSVPPGGMILQP